MDSNYIIVDVNHPNFESLVRRLSAEMKKSGGTLVPRFDELKNRALLQVKPSMSSWSKLSVGRDILFFGTRDEVQAEMAKDAAAWDTEQWANQYKPMHNDHVDFTEGRIDKKTYLNRLRGTSVR